MAGDKKKWSDLLQEISDNKFTNAELMLSFSSDFGLRFKILKDNDIKELAEAIKKNSHIQDLNLDLQAITALGCKYLSGLKLKKLVLSRTGLGKGAAEAFLNSDIRELNLSSTGIGDEDLEHLSLNPYIRRLNIRFNSFSQDAWAFFKGNTTIKELKITGNIDLKSLEILSGMKLDTLSLSRTSANDLGIKDSGAVVLSKSKTIQELSLPNQDISDIGAEALAANPVIRQLDISDNGISGKGLCFFLKNDSLVYLDFFGNGYGSDLCEALKAKIELNNLRSQRTRTLSTLSLFQNFLESAPEKAKLFEPQLIPVTFEMAGLKPLPVEKIASQEEIARTLTALAINEREEESVLRPPSPRSPR